MHDFLSDPRFSGLRPFEEKLWLSSPTMHGDERKWVDDAIARNWVSTVGENIDAVEEGVAQLTGCKYAVGLSSGTAALHLAVKLCGEKLYGQPRAGHGALEGKRAFCSDMTFDATVNPVAYEGGEAVFIDTETETWNMDPAALEKAFERYPEVKLIVLAHLYGTPCKMDEIRAIADRYGALIVEDAAESFLSTYKGRQTGSLGDVAVLSWNGNKLITGSSGGMLLTNEREWAEKARKWSTQSREAAPWYQHEEIGYNYRMSNIIAGVVRGQLPYAGEHLTQKRAIYARYLERLSDLPVRMNPCDAENSVPNCWLSCMLIDRSALCPAVRSDTRALYLTEPGKSCPAEILEALAAFNAEGRPLWKPMHLQPLYRMHPFITREGNGRARSNAYLGGSGVDVGADLFERGLCLPSDNKMTGAQQDRVIDIIHRCFQ